MRTTREKIVGNPRTSRHATRIAALGTAAAIAFTAFGTTAATADEQHKVSSGDTVSELAQRYGSTIDAIIAANRLNRRATIYTGATLTIPTKSGANTASSAKKSAKTVKVAASATGTHKVAKGDTVWALARKHHTTVSAIIKANGLNRSAIIHVGQKLTIPGKPAPQVHTSGDTSTKNPGAGVPLSHASNTSTSPTPASATGGTHKAVSGDTVWGLARTYGSTVSAIISANGLGKSAVIHVGQKIKVPGTTAPRKAGATTATTVSNVKNVTTSTASEPKLATDKNLAEFGAESAEYIVISGDTLSRISSMFGVSINAIVSANGIRNAGSISVGQKLSIPGGIPTGLVGDTFLGRTYSAPVVGAANQNKATLKAMDVPSKAQMQALVVKTAKALGVDPALAQAIAYQESGFNMRAVSPANAIGVMQVIPSSGKWASTILGRDLNLLIPEDNVTAGIVILKTLQRNGTPLSSAIGGYYQGETAVRKHGLYSDTVRYVASVKSLMTRF